MNERTLHRLADGLLARLVRVSPAGLRDWGEAMRGELPLMAGSWKALFWALNGSAWLLRRIIADRFRT